MKDISILILTYNAPMYVKETLETLHRVTNPEDLDKCEIIVWDNNSNKETKDIILELHTKKMIDKYHFSKTNLLFAGGNNEAAKLANPNSKYYLLLNSDIRIKNKNWLSYLFQEMRKNNLAGISYGFCKNPNRCDGYCFLIEKELYDKYQLDTEYQWWWGVTKLQAEILKTGRNLMAIYHHNHILYHYGGKSGYTYMDAKGMSTKITDIVRWFSNSTGKLFTKNYLFKANLLKYFI